MRIGKCVWLVIQTPAGIVMMVLALVTVWDGLL